MSGSGSSERPSGTMLEMTNKVPKLTNNGDNSVPWHRDLLNVIKLGQPRVHPIMTAGILPAMHPQAENFLGYSQSGRTFVPNGLIPLVVPADECIGGYTGEPRPAWTRNTSPSKSTGRTSLGKGIGSGPHKDDSAEKEEQADAAPVDTEIPEEEQDFQVYDRDLAYGWYAGDPFARPIKPCTSDRADATYAAAMNLVAELMAATLVIDMTLSTGLKQRLEGSKLYTEARDKARPDVMMVAIKKMVTTNTVGHRPQREMDATIFTLLGNLMHYKADKKLPYTAHVEELQRQWAQLKELGFDSKNSNLMDCLLGQAILKACVTPRNQRLMQDDLDADLLKSPKCTASFAESKIRTYETQIAGSQIAAGAEETTVKVHQAKAKEHKGKASGGKENSKKEEAKPKSESNAHDNRWCEFCRKKGDHHTAFCTDAKCPEEVKQLARDAYLTERKLKDMAKKASK